jgi:hypothetical protein
MSLSKKKEDFNVIKDIDKGKQDLTIEEHVYKLIGTIGGCLLLVVFLTINFVSLSCCLNINKDKEIMEKLAPVVFSFLFGFIYLAIYIFPVHIGRKKQTIEFNNKNVFPF